MNSRQFALALALALALSLASFACNSNDSTPSSTAGPIDGTFVQGSEVCGGTNSPSSTGSTLTIANTAWTLALPAKPDGCVVTDYSTVSYSNGTVTATQHSKTCSATCSGSECTANNTVQPTCTGTYSLSGSSLNITFTNFDCGGTGCDSTQADVNVLTKQ